jgi:hypothetical protein
MLFEHFQKTKSEASVCTFYISVSYSKLIGWNHTNDQHVQARHFAWVLEVVLSRCSPLAEQN